MLVIVVSVFALADEENAVAEGAVNQTHCQRLAKLFSVDAQALASQPRPSRTAQSAAIRRLGNKNSATEHTLLGD
ncbi:MAG: hypothetical protein ACKPKO_38180, partial [Candidatus Fonsibacter sp.]